MLEDLLLRKSSSILNRWLDAVFETYPADSQRFLRKQKDPFANPVGTTLRRELENLFGEIIRHTETEKLTASLDRIIRIRAVQDFSASQAVSFVLMLKRAVRSELQEEIADGSLDEELHRFESRIDDILLCAVDLYAKCKEKIFEIRVKESRNQVARLLERAGLAGELPPHSSREIPS
ncbi:MAG: RsbRD N-terminal domain-containing protein [Thermodesulfobacteriota bacterium]